MSIQANCNNCGRRHNVKDEYAGKKFRCQECETVVVVPMADDFESDGFGGDDWGAVTSRRKKRDDYEDYEDYDSPGAGGDDYEDYGGDEFDDFAPRKPAPARRKPAAKKLTKKKKSRPRRKPKSDSNVGGMIGKVGGGVLVGLFVLGLIGRLMSGGGFDLASWESYTTPDGNVTVQMPGKAKSVPTATLKDVTAGGQAFGVMKRNYACVIVIEPLPAEVKGFSEDEIFEAFEFGSGFIGANNVRRSTINGKKCIYFDRSEKGVTGHSMAFVHKNKMYTLNYAFRGSKGSVEEKFFNSVQCN